MKPMRSCLQSCFGPVLSLSVLALAACSHNEPGAAAAGSSGAAATPAAGGGGASVAGKSCPTDYTIDDCEDGQNQVKVQKGRNGYWYTFVDQAGSTISPPFKHTFIMSKGGPNDSAYAAQILGKVSATGDPLFAGMGFSLTNPKGQYDASAYSGVSFYAMVAAKTLKAVRLKVPDANTDPDGKVCAECFNDFGADLTFSNEWKQYTIPFSDMAQMDGWGSPHPKGIDKSKLYGVQWQVNAPGADYDIWVDNVAFTGCP
jgi:endoglucanase